MAPRSAYFGRTMCQRRAYAELAGLGDPALGEWAEWTGVLHLRRRLNAVEQAAVGPVRDIRGSNEAKGRLAAVPPAMLARVPAEAIQAEATYRGID